MPRSRWARLAVAVAVLVVLVVLGAAGAGGLYLRSVEKQVEKLDAFNGVPEAQRPPRVAEAQGALNFLVVGADVAEGGVSRTDTVMLVHVPKNRQQAQIISIPRDTWTTIPASADGNRGETRAKINAAYAWGGVPLLVRTVENFSGVRIDHVLRLDFDGFKRIIDVLGGVDVTVDRAFTTTVPPGRTYGPGVHLMDSAVALDYARERKQFRDGDFSRMRHQQAIVLAVLREAGQKGLLAEPGRFNDFLTATAGAVQVDKDLSIFGFAWRMRNLDSTDLVMLTSPSAGTGMVGDQSVVFPDLPAAARLYQAVKTDTMGGWLAQNPVK
jgi:LCP family protein required for cell wall assembly